MMNEMPQDLMRLELTELLESSEAVSKTNLIHAKHLAKDKYSSNITQDKEDVQLFKKLQDLYDEQNYIAPEVPIYTLDDVDKAQEEMKDSYKLGEETYLEAIAKYTKGCFCTTER